MVEAIILCETIANKRLERSYGDENRKGDHKWWVSDVTKFRADYPEWTYDYDIQKILEEIYEDQMERLASKPTDDELAVA
ncbi:uncharacterized protein METZ01_LOCUS458216 [marine metagenome]|uniref:Uncharacterized protein n=1 Tax=marine metagenome TaxID=408172 RepID=A0A383ACE5_9ZZZZ